MSNPDYKIPSRQELTIILFNGLNDVSEKDRRASAAYLAGVVSKRLDLIKRKRSLKETIEGIWNDFVDFLMPLAIIAFFIVGTLGFILWIIKQL